MAIRPGGASIVWALDPVGPVLDLHRFHREPVLGRHPAEAGARAAAVLLGRDDQRVVPGADQGSGQRRQARRGDAVVVGDQQARHRRAPGGSGGGSGIGGSGLGPGRSGGPGGIGLGPGGNGSPGVLAARVLIACCVGTPPAPGEAVNRRAGRPEAPVTRDHPPGHGSAPEAGARR